MMTAVRRWLLGWTLPPRNETIRLTGLSAPTAITVDRSGVPHIDAQSAGDAYFAQGYLHARDRLWQMELNRRIAQGELAGLFGPIALPTDRLIRRLGFGRAAERDLSRVSGEGRAALDAYTSGVNSYITHHRRPIEFLVIRARPRAWSPVDSLAFGRYMSWTQTENLPTEIVRRELAGLLGRERAAALEPGNPATSVLAMAGVGRGASNNWVIAPGRSASGKPLLANDPHLYPRIPAVWYVVHLRSADGLNVIGASLPALPGVVIGHNSRIGWGVTAGMADCEDLVDQTPPAVAAAATVREEIRVKGQAVAVEEVRITPDGPILNGTLGIPTDGPVVALRSVLTDADSPIDALIALNRAGDWASFERALERWHFPCLNFVYADVDGNIGYRMAGSVPLRRDGRWTGAIPFAEMPTTFNPDEGMVATANNLPAVPMRQSPDGDWIDDCRWTRIMQLLRGRPSHTLADCQAMQQDLTSVAAQQVAARLGRLSPADGLTRQAMELMERWDGRLDAASPEAALYQVFRIELLRALHGGLGDQALTRVLGRGPDQVIAPVSAFFFHGSSELVAWLDQAPDALIEAAFQKAVGVLRDRLGPAIERWRWGDLHRISFQHPIGLAVPLLDRLLGLSQGPYPIGGDADTVAQSGVDPWNPFGPSSSYSVSYRQVFDLADWDRAVFILPTGQSGHPASPHYADMVSAWRQGEYRPLPFSPQAVQDQAAETIRLEPAPLR